MAVALVVVVEVPFPLAPFPVRETVATCFPCLCLCRLFLCLLPVVSFEIWAFAACSWGSHSMPCGCAIRPSSRSLEYSCNSSYAWKGSVSA